MKLLFERSVPGRRAALVPKLDVPAAAYDASLLRNTAPRLPELSEVDLSRHYSELARQTHGVNDGFYPLGSCTMKYNPQVNEEVAALLGFADIHPLQPVETVQGCLEVMWEVQQDLQGDPRHGRPDPAAGVGVPTVSTRAFSSSGTI